MATDWQESDEELARLNEAAKRNTLRVVKAQKRAERAGAIAFILAIGLTFTGALLNITWIVSAAAGRGLVALWREYRRERRVRINYEKFAAEFD